MTKQKTETPLMRQYNEIKAKHPGTILLFRVGDFYETFSDDAVLVSKELGITLTKRNNGGDMTPLAGFPFHALDTYLPKLIKKGHRVAVCEQTEDPAEAKARKSKIVDREVTEITTPGVTLSDKLLDHNRNNYLVSLYVHGEQLGVAFCDVSTGELGVTEIHKTELGAFLSAFQPAELLTSRKHKNTFTEYLVGVTCTWIDDWVYEGSYGYELLKEHFRTHSLKGFGVEDHTHALVAAGALLHYVRENQKSTMAHIRRMYAHDLAGYMVLDASTKRTLELTSSMQDGRQEGTLISILDETRTAMGARLLRRWLMQPLRQIDAISNRLDSVEELTKNHTMRSELREVLGHVGDLERLLSRVMVGRSAPRDLAALKSTLELIDPIKQCLLEFHSELIQHTSEQLDPIPEVYSLIASALRDDPPSGLRDGGFIRDGFHQELDELRDITLNGKQFIARIQKELILKTGIHSLKLGYNKVFGYYIEITNAHKERIPEDFIRKQTLVNAERYITPELKEIEEKILSAEERIVALEHELFVKLCEEVAVHSDRLQQNAYAIAQMDVIQGLAEVAVRNNYVKPEVDNSSNLDIRAGRHPVVERLLPMGEPFIPNDILLDNDSRQIMIITGPNMAGKSVILRQTGLIVLLAQVGSFVPATKATIGLVDKIFTRVGASDNLAAGESTFLVEMNEAANILNNATPRSLILLDEVGRGTSTFDGLSIAWSLAEYVHNQPDVAAKTLFATHYHELNELASMYERIFNCNVQVQEHRGKVIFLRKLIEGGADHSYGIQVASMAGLPGAVIERATEILHNLEKHSLDITNKQGDVTSNSDNPSSETPTNRLAPTNAPTSAPLTHSSRNALKAVEKQPELPQLSLFAGMKDPRWETIRNRLEGIDPNRLTPIEALLLLTELKRELTS
jgi:DNA mismatch repair protein MutS